MQSPAPMEFLTMSIIAKPKAKRQSKKSKTPRSIEQYKAQSPKKQKLLIQVAHAMTAMRSEGLSLTKAAQVYHLDPRTMLRYAGSGLRKDSSNKYKPRPSDRLLRPMVIPTEHGLAEIAIRSSRDATKVAKYWDAVQWYLETGDASRLKPFQSHEIIDASGARVPLIVDLSELERLGSAGVLSFESIYAKAA